jgi:hypothetical protein
LDTWSSAAASSRVSRRMLSNWGSIESEKLRRLLTQWQCHPENAVSRPLSWQFMNPKKIQDKRMDKSGQCATARSDRARKGILQTQFVLGG